MHESTKCSEITEADRGTVDESAPWEHIGELPDRDLMDRAAEGDPDDDRYRGQNPYALDDNGRVVGLPPGGLAFLAADCTLASDHAPANVSGAGDRPWQVIGGALASTRYSPSPWVGSSRWS
ncbi:MAG: hypothetical protein WA888_15310 [Burkholderiaceae bacterium]